MSQINSDLYRGSFLSKAFGFISFVLLIFSVFQLITSNWALGIFGIVLSIATAYIGYRLAGGRRNPAIRRDKDLVEEKMKVGPHREFGTFEILKNKVAKGEIIVGVDKTWAYDWWRTAEELRSTNFSATLLLLKNWGFFAFAVFFLFLRQFALGVISILIGIAIVSYGKRQYTEEFRKHVISNPKSFIRFYTLGAVTLKSAKTRRTASFPEDWTILLEEQKPTSTELGRQDNSAEETSFGKRTP